MTNLAPAPPPRGAGAGPDDGGPGLAAGIPVPRQLGL